MSAHAVGRSQRLARHGFSALGVREPVSVVPIPESCTVTVKPW